MKIEVTFTTEDRQALERALGGEDSKDRLAQLIARAGAREALAQATGDAVFSSMTDLRSFRIYTLLAEGMTLSEAEDIVARLFKVPSSSAKRMVSAAVARYAVDLSAGLEAALKSMLESASWRKQVKRWEVRMPSSFLRERVFDALGPTELPDPERAQQGSLWRFADETYAFLRQHLGLSAKQHP